MCVWLCVCVVACMFAFLWLSARIYLFVHVSPCECLSACVSVNLSASWHLFFFFRAFSCTPAHCVQKKKKGEPDWPDHRGRWNLMDCRLSKLLLMGIWRHVFEGGKFNFLPLLSGAVWIAWPGIGEGVWHSRLPSHRESAEKVVSDPQHPVTQRRRNVARQRAVSLSVSPFTSISFANFSWTSTRLYKCFPFWYDCFLQVLILLGQHACKSDLYWHRFIDWA